MQSYKNGEDPRFSVYPGKWTKLLLLLGGVTSIVPMYFLSTHLYKVSYFQIGNALGMGVFFCFSAFCFYLFFGIPSLHFYKEKVKMRSFLGFHEKEFFFNEITKWTEIEKENKSMKWLDLTIYINKEKITISSSIYSEWGYNRMKKILTSGKRRSRGEEKNWQRRNTLYFVFGFSFIGFLLLFDAYNTEKNKNIKLEYSELSSFSDVLISDVKVKESGKRSSKHYWIELKLKSYPDLIFDIDNLSYKATNVGGLLTDVKKNDTLELFIAHDDYQKKITKEKPFNFWDKHFYSSEIDVYELRFKNRQYLELRKYNLAKNNVSSFFLIGIALFLFGVSLYMYLFE